MSHSTVLTLLTPLSFGESFAHDTAIEGAHLDLLENHADKLLSELYANSSYELLEGWERNYGSAPFYNDPLSVRINRVVQKMSELGRLDRAYFTKLASALGYTIVLEELHPFMTGWSGAGDELGDDASDWCWRVYYSDGPEDYAFRAGEAAAGEHLSYSFTFIMQQVLNDLKPADTFVEFIEV